MSDKTEQQEVSEDLDAVETGQDDLDSIDAAEPQDQEPAEQEPIPQDEALDSPDEEDAQATAADNDPDSPEDEDEDTEASAELDESDEPDQVESDTAEDETTEDEPIDEAGEPEEPTSEADESDADESDTQAADETLSDDFQEVTTESVVEAILFATDSPLPAKKISQVLGVGDARDVKKHIQNLNEKYEENGSSFRIEEVARGFQMMTTPAYNGWLAKLLKARSESKLSPAALETLAIIAYKQPVLRVDIETIRGVAAGDMVNRLREMNMVKIVGRAEEVGRPMLYGTTRRFLEVFGLASLDDLPKAEELKPPAN